MTNFITLKTSVLELIVLAMFIIYIVLPVKTPYYLAPLINSTLGMLLVFIVTIYLVLYTHPILAIVSIFVAYELMRRSYLKPNEKHVRFDMSQSAKDAHLKKLNPKPAVSLEEDMVAKITPVYSDSIAVSTFKPVLDDLHNALKL